jgi:hypothetical protein
MIPITIKQSIDRMQLDIFDEGKQIFSRLKNMFIIRRDTENRRKYYFKASRDDRTKFVYQFKTKSSGPDYLSTLHVHDVSMADQDFLVNDLIDGRDHRLDQIEFATDFIPQRQDDLFDLGEVLSEGLALRYGRLGQYGSFGRTRYWGKEGMVRPFNRHGKWKRVIKGIRLYPKERQFMRLELQVNADFIRKHRLTLPISPDAFSALDFVTYRERLLIEKLANYLYAKQSRNRPVTKWSGLLRAVIHDWVTSEFFPESTDPYEDLPHVAQQIDKFKLVFPGYKNIYLFFPETAKKEKLLEDISHGFIKRKY